MKLKQAMQELHQAVETAITAAHNEDNKDALRYLYDIEDDILCTQEDLDMD